MEISTFSIVIGNKACNARCPFCVSRMTGFDEVKGKPVRRGLPVASAPPPNFESAAELAKIAGTTTVLLTGKGEPTLAPDEISSFLEHLTPYKFPFIELQTNALAIGRSLRDGESDWAERLGFWRSAKLNTIAISVVSTDDEKNAEIYHKDYPPLANTIKFLHELGFTVRLSLMLVDGIVDSPYQLLKVIDWCKEHNVEQLTVRPIRRPENAKDEGASDFVRERGISAFSEAEIMRWVDEVGTKVLTLSHGAAVFDVYGQNVCLTDCLTVPESPNQIRTLIYYSSGRIAYHWQYPGAVLLGGSPQ